ncbi:MAG: relaxase/mobilization nuclease domain-containing protein [Acinetobacter sp.]
MIVDFFEHGTGEASGPLDYFLGKNRDREHAKILLGDVNEVAELIDCSPYEKRYTSGCLSFYESDLTEADKAQIMRDFEKTLFPGLTTGNYRILWVEHRDKINEETGERRLELNFLIPNIEIESGKRLQPFFAKADLDRVDAFKKIVNYEHDLFDPDDPLNRRSVKIAQNLPKESKEFKAQVHDEITLAICDDLIYDRKTLLDWCETVGFEVTKITKKQISIKNPETGRPEVFKGEFYEQNFRNTAKSTELKAEASGRYRQRAEKRYQTCIERHEKLCEAKSKYHLERYGNGNRESRNGLDPKFTEPKNRNAIENRQSGEQLQQQYSGIEQGSSEADSRHEPTFADIAVIKPRNNRTSEAEKSPYFINFSPDFSATYFAYQQYVFRLYQQNKLQRTKPDQDITADRASEASRSETSFKFEQSRVTEEISANCIQGLENEFRSPTFEDHRRTAIAVEATTARTTESTRAYTSAISDYRAVKGLHEDFKREAQRSSDDRTEISADGAETIRANYLSNFFRNYARELESTVTNTFKRFSEELGDRERSQELDQARITEYGASRDRTAIEADDRANNQENEFRRAISTKISGVNPTSIFTALDVLDQRRELEREQARKNDRGYDSPRPF